MIELFFHLYRIVFTSIINKSIAFVLMEFAVWHFQTLNIFYFEMLQKHLCSKCALKTSYDQPPGELLFLFNSSCCHEIHWLRNPHLHSPKRSRREISGRRIRRDRITHHLGRSSSILEHISIHAQNLIFY